MMTILKNIWRTILLYITGKQSLFSKESENITDKYMSEQWRQIKDNDDIKRKQWKDNVKQKYSNTKNCVNIEIYEKILEYLKYAGHEELKLESYYNENTNIVTFILSDKTGIAVCYNTTIRALNTHYYSKTLNKLSESICMLWNNLECETDEVLK